MDNYDVKRFGLILAVQAEIEGMKADNHRQFLYHAEPRYKIADFNTKAEELRNIAHAHNDQL